MVNASLFDLGTGFVSVGDVASTLRENHYLGPISRGIAWKSDVGVIVVANPSSRRLPLTWMELVRWCIIERRKNAGSEMWARFVREFRNRFPETTTIVSYSDPSQGHTGALYRACNWKWAPTWHAIRPPPSGHGEWTAGKPQSVKDRWVFAMRRDSQRPEVLAIKDESILRRWPDLRYREPAGVPYHLKALCRC